MCQWDFRFRLILLCSNSLSQQQAASISQMIAALYFPCQYLCDLHLHRLWCYRKCGVSMETEAVKSNDDDKVMIIFERLPVNLQNCERHTSKSSLQNASNPTCACSAILIS